MEKGLQLSTAQNNSYQTRLFLVSLLLTALDKGDVAAAGVYLSRLEKDDTENQFTFERSLGKAVIAGFAGQSAVAEKYFAEAEKAQQFSEFTLPRWKIRVAEKNKEWQKVLELNRKVLELTLQENFRDDLPAVYFDFAKAYFNLRQPAEAAEYLEKTLAIIEEIRVSENNNLTLGILETYHDAYRLLTQLNFDNSLKAFETADFLKARFLKDRIDNAAVKDASAISAETRKQLEELSLKYIEDEKVRPEIEKIEKLITISIPELNLPKPDLSELEKTPGLNDVAIISYFFTPDGKLFAFVAEAGKPLRKFDLRLSEKETEEFARTAPEKIKNFIFFKRDGKAIYDKLLKPLGLSAARFIIIPDKSLWKIPFQALSADGEKYLIQEKIISYAPSVSILLDQLKQEKPLRQALQAFANAGNSKLFLRFVNPEATAVATIYGTKPVIDAKIADFQKNANTTDILHFSMHAKLDGEQPLDSFLAFRESKNQTGRLTVGELLNIKLKKGSLIFLASCETGSILNGEGLVSLSWAMTAGATTVISSNWEVDDKSTETFTVAFYKSFRQGTPAAVALQKAALELIKNKSNNMHEPYYWAGFSLSGDFR